jgi:hypothetical protein
MNRLRLIILALGALSIVSSCAVGDSGNDKVKFFYIPFDVETYYAITIENIEQAANCEFELERTNPVVKQLAIAVDRAEEGRFWNGIVRLKAVGLFENALFVDKQGGSGSRVSSLICKYRFRTLES